MKLYPHLPTSQRAVRLSRTVLYAGAELKERLRAAEDLASLVLFVWEAGEESQPSERNER